MRRRAFTWADGLLLGALLAANGVAAWTGASGRGPAAGAEVIAPSGARTVAFGALPRSVRVQGPLGTTVVEVGADGVRVTSSPCPLQLCVGSGTARRPGQVIACLPNRVAVRVLGDRAHGAEGAVDAVGR
ncbi:MAG: hypothetical protein Kow0092_13790 [Deferrisomatales bacterium]